MIDAGADDDGPRAKWLITYVVGVRCCVCQTTARPTCDAAEIEAVAVDALRRAGVQPTSVVVAGPFEAIVMDAIPEMDA